MGKILLQFKLKPLFIIVAIMMTWQWAAAQITVNGVVSDETGAPLPGVNVLLQNTATGTVTDRDGKYELVVSDGTASLSFSYIGYVTAKVPIDNRTVINVTMVAD